MHLFVPGTEDAAHTAAEIRRAFPDRELALEARADGLLAVSGLPAFDASLPPLAFARQVLPEATLARATSIRGWAEHLATRLIGGLPETAPWRLHLWSAYGAPGSGAGAQRCRLIRETLVEHLQKHRRHLLRRLEPARETTPFTAQHSLVQLVLTTPEEGFLSITPAPGPAAPHRWLSPFAAGDIPVASDKSAPSRAFAKLVETEQRLGLSLSAGETCVDLGACPGSWSYVAVQRGCQVTAVDRSPLRPDLMAHPQLRFHAGDAFRFTPEAPVDWLLCDVIAAPQRNLELLLRWLDARLCRRFIVTLKFKGTEEYPLVDDLKRALPLRCRDFLLARLCANKNEVCAAGVARE